MATITSNGTGGGLWHDSSSWSGGVVPAVNDTVVVDMDDVIELDGDCECGDGVYTSNSSPYSTSSNFRLWLKGTVKASRTIDSSLAVKGMIGADVATGWQSTLDFGTEADPIPSNISFKWYMNKSGTTLQGYYYGTGFYGRSSTRLPKIYMRSAQHRVRNVYLVGEYSAGVTEIEVNDADGWQVGDELLLAPKWTSTSSSPYTNYDYDEVTITSMSGTTIGITATTYAHGYADANDYGAGAVSNKSSNVQLRGGGDNNIFPSIYISHGLVDMKDVRGFYMNNRYSLSTACIRMNSSRYYDGQTCDVESCYFDTDSRNFSDSMQGVIYHYAPYDRYEQTVVNDVAIGSKGHSSYTNSSHFSIYYGGRNTLWENCNAYNITKNGTRCFNAYQQPATLNNCKLFNASFGYNLHDNVDIDTNDCWVVGCDYPLITYNGTAIYKDMHIRWVDYLARFQAGWRGKFVSHRLDFDDIHVNRTEKDYVYTPTGLPYGNEYKFVDLQNDTDKQRWYYSYGQKWWETIEVRKDSHSIAMKSTSDTYAIPHERTFNATTGDAILVGLYVKNLTATFIGTLTMSILQGSDVIATQDFDITTLTVDEWSLLSISGTATKTMNTTFKMKYKGNGGEIALTDFSQPFVADQKAQAKAVWAELTSENKVLGSFGEMTQDTNNNAELAFLTN